MDGNIKRRYVNISIVYIKSVYKVVIICSDVDPDPDPDQFVPENLTISLQNAQFKINLFVKTKFL